MLSFFSLGVLDEMMNLIESVSEDFPSYSCTDFASSTRAATDRTMSIGINVKSSLVPQRPRKIMG